MLALFRVVIIQKENRKLFWPAEQRTDFRNISHEKERGILGWKNQRGEIQIRCKNMVQVSGWHPDTCKGREDSILHRLHWNWPAATQERDGTLGITSLFDYSNKYQYFFEGYDRIQSLYDRVFTMSGLRYKIIQYVEDQSQKKIQLKSAMRWSRCCNEQRF